MHSANLGWRNVPFRSLLSESLNLEVRLSHDVRSAGRAEFELVEDTPDDAVMITIGTGIAAAIRVGRSADLRRRLCGRGGIHRGLRRYTPRGCSAGRSSTSPRRRRSREAVFAAQRGPGRRILGRPRRRACR
ncbi:ROK family protein [Brevibacterium sp. UCMA 11754]|uniref:ROK family protein n=1 Tax=Brevibacterium sp. UCMA 11754 TaxID=2749198 RepID=UPI003FA405F6